MPVLAFQAFELSKDAIDSEFVFQLPTTVLKSLVVQKNDVCLRKLLASLTSHSQIYLSHKRDIQLFNLFAGNDCLYLAFGSLRY
jgi:hypothetical protein